MLVNFANGNVENPYVVGGLSLKGNKVPGSLAERDIVLSSPGGHTLRMDDGSGAGLTAFLAGVLFPGYDLLTTFVPQTSGPAGDLMVKWGADPEISRNFEGGFQLTDRYGIYTISGSTDGRNVSVKSPWGDVAINAFTGITISAPNGDIEIKGKNVTIEAGNNLELKSGTDIGKRLRAPEKDTFMGGVGANAAEIGLAVAKKLAEKVNLIDMSYVRALAELLKRPAEGALTVKSRRFLKLEAGKGECEYPKDAYKDKVAQKKIEDSEEAIIEGLKVKAGMKELVKNIKGLAAEVDKRYTKAYNKCVDLRIADGGLEDVITRAMNLATRNNGQIDPICHSYEELKDRLWQKPYKELTAEEIGFNCNGNYGLTIHDVNSEVRTIYTTIHPDLHMTNREIEDEILKERRKYRNKILEAANKLHEAICQLQDPELLNGHDINKVMGRFWFTHVPDNYKKSLKDAFNKDKLEDCFYYMPVTEEKKALTTYYEFDEMQRKRQALQRKAAILLLEGLGFKDEWRDENVERPFKWLDTLTGTKWSDYVNSINSVPKLTPLQFKGTGILMDGLKGILDFENIGGIWDTLKGLAGGNANNGEILFSSGSDTYRLKDTIDQVEGFEKEKADSSNQLVRTFLDELKAELNQL